ncbi:MAG TPA: lytic transglycosylase domain-containing protein [bacterium]|nr:lytic transglycosylase domain-containing protein [bacterium]
MNNSIAQVFARVREITERFGLKAAVPADAATAPAATAAGAATTGGEFARAMAAATAQDPATRARIDRAVSAAAERYQMNPDLIRAVIEAESGFNPAARSGAGAMGLMQLMPGTASALGVDDPYAVEENIDGGTRYLSQMLSRFGSVPEALAAYNAGPGAVQKAGGVPAYAETRNYVAKIMRQLDGQA